jgi:signal transduction histidine kinase
VAASAGTTHVRALDVFVDVLSQVDGQDQPTEFYGRLAEALCRLTSMERALIFRYEPEDRQVRLAGAYNVDVDLFVGRFVTVETLTLARQSLEEDRVIELFEPFTAEIPGEFASLLVPGRNLVCVPISAAGRWVGIVLADRDGGTPLSEEEQELLWTLGKTTALAATARIATTQMERARALEQRIDTAREIHDGVVQRLFGVSLALSSGSGDWAPADRARAAEELQTALHDLRIAVQRPLGRPSPQTATTFARELERLADQHPALGVTLDGGDPTDVPPALESLAQSILLEAVRNARKHATPTAVPVRVERQDGTFVLTVSNDGIREGERRGVGMGLRLAALESLQHGGILEFGRPRPGWWQVKLMVPDGG